MIGAVCCKLNNEYEFRLYLLGTYNQIDWQTSLSCALGDNYVVTLTIRIAKEMIV